MVMVISPSSADTLEKRFRNALPPGIDEATLRVIDEESEWLAVTRGTVQPVHSSFDSGAMVTVWSNGGTGIAATSDLSEGGLRSALAQAAQWARATAARAIAVAPPALTHSGSYASPLERSWAELDLGDRIDLLRTVEAQLVVDDRIVDTRASLGRRDVRSLLISSAGGQIEQTFNFVYPMLVATAANGADAQTRTYGRGSYCGQGGIEVLDRHGFGDAAPQLGAEAVALLEAPNCPTATMDIVVAPDQMILQIHESIGHPLELDRILGDERNYAGTSFVTSDMFGTFRYGSDLLNVTFDPTVSGQLASYAFDDDGTPATRHHLIKDGILVRPLGSATSQARSGMEGVANSRASSWNRPPIDRMANLNIEPGTSPVDELVRGIENGVFMHTNNSWSIDDSRNKFQFGCELGQVIRNGELAETVRNPGYRGISRNFWRNLSGVGDQDSFAVMGTPNCGKGELNQVIGTGHASPACRFSSVEVFGAEA
ncbi:MAG: TldD/PmbA family protein [Acidimicrobiales bacterium]|jgi:predicted Zn-dependent protease